MFRILTSVVESALAGENPLGKNNVNCVYVNINSYTKCIQILTIKY